MVGYVTLLYKKSIVAPDIMSWLIEQG
jgi:hypothetical protein